MADPADINVDELRRRARRRLVGAIVLALAAAVVVPMLLESDPKPLGESVAVKIPPVDDGKFVNRLSDGTPKGPATATEPRRDGAPAPEGAARKSIGDAEKAVVAPSAKGPKYDTQIAADKSATPAIDASAKDAAGKDAAAASKDAPVASDAAAPKDAGTTAPAAAAATPASSAATLPSVGAKPDAKSDARPGAAPHVEAKAMPEPPAPHAVPANGAPKDGFSVQLAAFSDDKGANSLANRLKRSGYPAYTEPLKTTRGTLWRVRVGPYASRDAATSVRDKLKTEGQNGIVAPSR